MFQNKYIFPHDVNIDRELYLRVFKMVPERIKDVLRTLSDENHYGVQKTLVTHPMMRLLSSYVGEDAHKIDSDALLSNEVRTVYALSDDDYIVTYVAMTHAAKLYKHDIAKKSRFYQTLLSIKGVGKATATAILTQWSDAQLFCRANKMKACALLTTNILTFIKKSIPEHDWLVLWHDVWQKEQIFCEEEHLHDKYFKYNPFTSFMWRAHRRASQLLNPKRILFKGFNETGTPKYLFQFSNYDDYGDGLDDQEWNLELSMKKWETSLDAKFGYVHISICVEDKEDCDNVWIETICEAYLTHARKSKS